MTHDLELVVITHALNMWRHYHLDIKFVLMTYHGGPKYLFDQPTLNVRQVRWLSILSKFDIEIKYIKGKENKVVDALSRRIQLNHRTTINSYGIDLIEIFKHERQHDEKYQQVKENLQ